LIDSFTRLGRVNGRDSPLNGIVSRLLTATGALQFANWSVLLLSIDKL
jgi:hypothetical protein